MRFLVSNELKDSPVWRMVLLGLGFFILLFLILDLFLHHYQIGLDLDSAQHTLFGDEATFEEPILIGALLLVVHIDLFTSMFILLLLGALYIRLFENDKNVKVYLHFLFFSGLVAPLMLLGVYLTGKGVALWIGLFLFWHLLAFFMTLRIVGRVW